MESYQEETEEEQALTLPVIIEHGALNSIDDVLRILPRALAEYFSKEANDAGRMPEQDLLEWLSDGGKIDLRLSAEKLNSKILKNSQVAVETLGHTVIFEDVVITENLPLWVKTLPKHFVAENRPEKSNRTSSPAMESFAVPLVSIVADPSGQDSTEELLNQVCFTMGSIFFTLDEDELTAWEANNFRVEVFLEEDIKPNANVRVMTSIEETGGVISTGFWID